MLLLAAFSWALFGMADLYNFYYVDGHNLSARIVGSGSLTNTLLTSHIYGVFAALLASYFLAKKLPFSQQVLIILAFLATLAFIVQTHSRTPLLGLSAVIIVLILKHHNKKAAAFAISIALLSTIYLAFNIELVTQRGLSYRPEIWLIALERISNKPFIGHGLATEMSIYIPSLKKTFSDSHNIHIGLLYDLGLVGFFTWLITLTYLFRLYIRQSGNILISMAGAALVYGVVAGMTEGGGFFTRPKEVWFLIWLPIASLIASEASLIKQTKK